MATLSDIQKQIAKLEKQAEVLLKEAAAEAAKKAAALIKQHGLTAEDVGLAPNAGKAAAVKKAVAKAKQVTVKPAGMPKYRDPKTGKTWTGNGKAPGWIAGAKNRDKFLISAPETAAQLESAPAAAPVQVVAASKKSSKKAVVAAKPAATNVVATKTAKPVAVPVKKAAAKKSTAKKPAAPTAPVEVSADGELAVTPPAATSN
jgi:DNA-binding protein H-NS